jgi:aminopeptidase N
MRLLFGHLLLLAFLSCTQAQTPIYDSGGPLLPEQAAFDVGYYQLYLEVFPEQKRIDGNLSMTATALEPLSQIVLHLDTLLQVSAVKQAVEGKHQPIAWQRQGGLIYASLPAVLAKGESFSVRVEYAGYPLAVDGMERGTWADGFFWEQTESGAPWVGNVSVLNGADIWWPCKDHPSDEADSMAISITAPQGLTVAMNGQFRGKKKVSGTQEEHRWFLSTPVNNYAVSLNIAPYQTIDTVFVSEYGYEFPFTFWVLPEHYEKAQKQFPHLVREMAFLESYLGPYPFRKDKYGIAETYYLGMETQSIIAYGSNFELNDYGFDGLHYHELVHEWFANLVTAKDWKDWWIHESFATYMEAIYAEYLNGEEKYHEYVSRFKTGAANEFPIARRGATSARTGYTGDVYVKGAAMLHTLRYLIGKEKLAQAIRRLAYPDPEMEQVNDGSHCRLASTAEFQRIFEEVSGQNLSWFFDAYLYYASLPVLEVSPKGQTVFLSWETPSPAAFEMPVPVRLGEETIIVKCRNGLGQFTTDGQEYEIDPQGWLLAEIRD